MERKHIDDIATVIMGQSPKSEHYNSDGVGVPFLQGNRTFGRKYPTFDTFTTAPTKLAKANDIIMSVRAPVGDLNITPVDMCLGRGVCALRMNNGNQQYLFYLLKNNIRQLINKESGTVFGSVNRNDIGGLEVEVHDEKTQERIASFLTQIDDKIENNYAINNNLQQQAETLFLSSVSCCSHYLKLGDIADVKGGKRLPKGINLISTPNAHPYIRVRDLNDAIILQLNSQFEYVDDETQRGISRYIVSEGDVILSIVGTIGLTAIIGKSLHNANLTENCVKITNLKSLFPEYIFLHLRSIEGSNAIARGTVGAVQPKLPLKNIQAINIPIIDSSKISSLQEVLSPLFAAIANNIYENRRLEALRDCLLPKLMSGEIDVSNIDG